VSSCQRQPDRETIDASGIDPIPQGRRPGALIERAPDAELLRETIGFAAQSLMELEVGELTARRATGAAQWLPRSVKSAALRPEPARWTCTFPGSGDASQPARASRQGSRNSWLTSPMTGRVHLSQFP
jgi:hypothetical protein